VTPCPHPPRTAWILLGVVALLALAASAAALLSRSLALSGEARVLAAQQRLQERLRPVAPASIPRPVYYADAQTALRHAALPEAQALTELESVSVVGIQLKSIDLDGTRSRVVVELDAASDGALSNYLDELNVGHEPPVWRIQSVSSVSGSAAP